MQDKARAHIIVSGRVQGVFFRAYAKQKADQLDIFGWVKNTDDGRVELIIEGDKAKVSRMVDWLEAGPKSANVENIEVEPEVYQGEFADFKIIANDR